MFTTAVCLWLAIQASAETFSWGFLPEPIIPADNVLTLEKVTLGRRLFSETALSINGTYSCASCHQPNRHFTDGLPRAIGATGEQLQRNTPTLYNVAFNASFSWQDQGLTQLEQQHLLPLFNTAPLEMGYSDASLLALARSASYRRAFAAAFTEGAITTDNLIKALACYVRTITAPASAFDSYLFQDDKASLSLTAIAGMELFFSKRLGCAGCHVSLNLSGPIKHTLQAAEPAFHVTGVNGSNTAFRPPTLRMIRHTGPYMHDGSLASLGDVIQHYQQGDAEGVPDFILSSQEQQQLIAFLNTL